MGMYTNMILTCKLKSKYTDIFDDIVNNDAELTKYFDNEWTRDYRADFIIRGGERSFDVNTRILNLDIEVKNYEGVIEKFFDFLPELVESVDYCYTSYEGHNWSTLYKLKNNKIVESEKELNYEY